MNKKSIDKHISSCNEIEQKIIEIKRNLEYSRSINLSEYNPVDREQARKSIENADNEIVCTLIEIHEDILNMIKKIDPEALKNEFITRTT